MFFDWTAGENLPRRFLEHVCSLWRTSRLYGLRLCFVIAALVAAGRRLRAHETAMHWTLGIFALLYWLSYNIWWNRNGFDPAIGLPLHICDLSGVIAPLALLTLNRWLRATLYFWAFALATQAFIQPALAAGPALPLFWWFWASTRSFSATLSST
jgi:uncharacterized membrane protein YwaF